MPHRAPGSPGRSRDEFLSGKPIHYYRPKGSADIRHLIDEGFQAFNAGRLSESCQIFSEKWSLDLHWVGSPLLPSCSLCITSSSVLPTRSFTGRPSAVTGKVVKLLYRHYREAATEADLPLPSAQPHFCGRLLRQQC